MGRDHGHQPHRHAARLPRLWPSHDRATLWAHHQHWISHLGRGAVRGGGLRGEQGGRRGPHEIARHRGGAPRWVRERDPARSFPDRTQRGTSGRHRTRWRAIDPDADAALWSAGGGRGRRGIPRVGSGGLRDWSPARGGWRLSRQRRESIARLSWLPLKRRKGYPTSRVEANTFTLEESSLTRLVSRPNADFALCIYEPLPGDDRPRG